MQYAQIFRYTLSLNSSEYSARFVEPYALAISGVNGLIRKTWMADFDQGIFASVYIWSSKSAMDAFMASPAIAKVASEPFIKDLSITSIPVHEEASAITRG
jgi:Putative mono-oxygenase ydhR